MKTRRLLFLSLALNAGLAGGTVWLLKAPRPEKASPPLLQTVSSQPGPIARAAPVPPPVPAVIQQTNRFRWSTVASTHYPAYADNLRAVGCPEAVVRDIILAAVNQEFAGRRHALFQPVHAQFWELVAQGSDLCDGDMEEQEKGLRNRRQKILAEILGAGWQDTLKVAYPNQSRRLQLSFLPEEIGRQLERLDDQFQTRRTQIHRATRARSPEQTAQLQALEQEHDQALAALLTADQYEEYKLRTAPGAEWAMNATGFDASHEEFRALARLRAEVPKGQTNEFNAQARAILGEDRFATLQRGQDSRFQHIRREIDRCRLPPDTAIQLYQLRLLAEQQAAIVRAHSSFTGEVRAALLAQLQEETRHAIAQSLGAHGEVYLRKGGEWLTTLARP